MKHYIFIILLLLSAYYSNAQKTAVNFPYKMGQPYRVFDFDNIFYFSKGDEIMTVKFIRSHTIIQKFESATPSLVKDKKYEGFFPGNFKIEDVIEIGQHYYFFFSVWDGKQDKEQLFSIEIDFAQGEFIGQPKLLFAAQGKVSGVKKAYGFFNLGTSIEDKFDFVQAQDKSNLLIQYRKVPAKKNDKASFDIIGLHLFDENLNTAFAKEIRMPYSERKMNNLDYQVDKQGNLYLLTKVYHDDSNDDKKNKSDLTANYHIELFTIKSGSDQIEMSRYDNKDKFINQLWIKDSGLGHIVCVGLYSGGERLRKAGFMSSKMSNYDDCKGIVVLQVQPDGKFSNENFYEISTDLINRYEKAEKKKEDKLPYLELRDIDIMRDGSMIIIGEQYHTEVMGGGRFTEFRFDDILISKIDASGKLVFMNRIPKSQMALNENQPFSYRYFKIDNNPCLVFVDNIKNLKLPADAKPHDATADLTIARVSDRDGSFSKEFILNTTEINGFKLHKFAMNRFLKISEEAFIFEAYKKDKEDIMIKVDLK